MELLKNEEVLMDGDNKQIVLTTHRIRQENKSFGQINIVSIMLEDVTSCEYVKTSKPIFLLIGILFNCFAFFIGFDKGEEFFKVSGGIFLLGILFVYFYFINNKRGLFISSPSSKIKINTRGMKDENIKSFIDKLEIAKNDRYINQKSY